jgi:hypothetical protein
MGDGMDDELRIERIGGFAGFGASPHLKSRGSVRLADLPAAERDAVEALFRSGGGGAAGAGKVRDGFTYRLTRDGGSGPETVEVPESHVPPRIAASVRDTLD